MFFIKVKKTCFYVFFYSKINVFNIYAVLVFFSVPPRINGSRTVDETSVVIGSSSELQCHASGVPQPTVRWVRDGQFITFVDHPNLRVENAGQTLRLHNMQLIDIGMYTCVASNVAGNATKQFLINILGQCDIPYSYRMILFGVVNFPEI